MKAAVRAQLDSTPAHAETTSLLFQAVKLGDLAAIETLIAAGVNVNAATKAGTTPLMIAASFGQLTVLRMLNERGAVINKTRSDGFNALTLAVFFGHEDIVRELLTRGADINGARSRGGTTPEMWATVRGFPDIAGLLEESRERTYMPAGSRFKDFPQAPKSLSKSTASEIKHQEQTVDPDEFFDEGIRRVGQTEWTKTPPSVIAPQERSEADAFSEEGIRRVGQTKWTTTPPLTDAGTQRGGFAKESGDEGINKTDNGERITTSRGLIGQRRADAPGGSLGEGIRRVGQNNWTTADPTELTRYYPKVATESFSAFSTVSERLGLGRKHLTLVATFVVAIIALVSITFLKPLKDEAQPASENLVDAPRQSSAIKREVPATEEVKSQTSVSAQTEQVPSGNAEFSAIQDSSQGDRVKHAASQEAPTRDRDQTVGDPDIAKSIARDRVITIASPSSNQRPKRTIRPSKQVETIRETSAPAAITIVTSEPPKERVRTPTAISSQPTTVIEGSSNKKKVIQWP